MKLVGRIPVEPLDDERMTHIERRIVAEAAEVAARAPIRESRLPLVLAVALVAVVVLGAGALGWRLRGGDDPRAIAGEAPIVVETTTGRSVLDIGDARLTIDPATALVITRPEAIRRVGDTAARQASGAPGDDSRPSPAVLVALARGKVELEVGKRGERGPLVVRAGDTDVVVVGTRFSVDHGDGTGRVDVRVTEGVVTVVRHRRETRVATGQAWTTADGLVAIAELAARAEPTAAGRDPAGGELEIDMGKEPDVALHGRVAKVPDARTPAGSGAPAGGRTHGRHEPHRTLDSSSDPQVDLKTAIRNVAVAPPLDAGTTDARRALAIYGEQLIGKTGDEASAALYSIAYVQHLRLGRDADALATLEKYMRRFQGGKEYLPALWLRVRISCLRSLDSACRQAAYTYVHEAGDSAAGKLAERITTSQ